MKKIILIIFLGLLTFSAKSQSKDSLNVKFTAFAKQFAERISEGKKATVLIGFKTAYLNDSIKQTFKQTVESLPEQQKKEMNKNIFIADDYSFYRIFFPLNAVTVDYDGNTYATDEKGLVIIPNLNDLSKLKVVNIIKSETRQGGIRKDSIKFAFEIDKNICVFDLGALSDM